MDLVGKAEGKRPLVRPKRRWDDNIKIYLQLTEWESVEWSDLAQDTDKW
jgi:hypothetical protein